MAPPPIQLMLTTIASQPALRQRQEYLLRVLQVKKIPFVSYDLASDEEAKRLWRRKAPLDKQQLPGILVGGRFPGTFSEFEEAVEYSELDIFLRRNEEWDEDDETKLNPPAMPVGVPGAYSPSQMHPKYNPPPSPHPPPSPLKGKGKEDKSGLLNAGEHLSEFGIHDVEVSSDDLRALIEELGLGGDDANDLAMGLGSDSKAAKAPEPAKPVPTEEAKPEPKAFVKQEEPAVVQPNKPEAEVTKEEAKEQTKEESKEEVKDESKEEIKETKEEIKETKEDIEEESKEEVTEESKQEAKEVLKVETKEEVKVEVKEEIKEETKDTEEVKEAEKEEKTKVEAPAS